MQATGIATHEPEHSPGAYRTLRPVQKAEATCLLAKIAPDQKWSASAIEAGWLFLEHSWEVIYFGLYFMTIKSAHPGRTGACISNYPSFLKTFSILRNAQLRSFFVTTNGGAKRITFSCVSLQSNPSAINASQ